MERRESGVKIFLRNLTTIGLPNIAGLILAAPIERYSIICQTRSLSKQPAHYSSFKEYMVQVPAREGISGFFRGSFIRVLHYFTGSVIAFRFYHYILELCQNDENSNKLESDIKKIFTNFNLFILTELFAYNFERARTLVACDFTPKDTPRFYNGSFEVFSSSARSAGIKSVYSGYPLYIGSFGFFLCVSFGLSSTFEDLGIQDNKWATFFIYGVAKSFVYPLDVLRRRRQVSGTHFFESDYPQFYKQLEVIAKKEGLKGLYKGFLPSMAYTFACFNLISLFAGNNNYFNTE